MSKRPMSGPDDPRNPYGVTRPLDRMALAAIYLATGILPDQEIMDQLEREMDQLERENEEAERRR